MLKWLGLGQTEYRVLIAGNDSAGKTTLLYRAKTGELINTVATIGFNEESLSPLGNEGSPRIFARDIGGGCRIGSLYLHHVVCCSALVFVIRPTDPRLWSALWELYVIVKHAAQNGNPGVAVCVVVPINECSKEDGSCCTRESGHSSSSSGSSSGASQASSALGSGAESRTTSSYAAVAKMAERESLPPGGSTQRWSRERRWALGEEQDGAAAATVADDEAVDREWLPGWEKERQAMVGRPGHALTAHGMNAVHTPEESPQLATIHHGPWVVLPIDMHARAGDAMLPFQWIARQASAYE